MDVLGDDTTIMKFYQHFKFLFYSISVFVAFHYGRWRRRRPTQDERASKVVCNASEARTRAQSGIHSVKLLLVNR